jgi:hypothetical protein
VAAFAGTATLFGACGQFHCAERSDAMKAGSVRQP